MKRILIATALCLWVVSPAAISSADTLIMSDGTRVHGTVVGITTQTITFRHVDGITRRYSSSQVQGVEFLSAEHPRPGALRSRGLAVRAGTDLLLRTAETVDSHHAEPNRTVSAIVEHAVMRARMIRHSSLGGATGSPAMVLDVEWSPLTGGGTWSS